MLQFDVPKKELGEGSMQAHGWPMTTQHDATYIHQGHATPHPFDCSNAGSFGPKPYKPPFPYGSE